MQPSDSLPPASSASPSDKNPSKVRRQQAPKPDYDVFLTSTFRAFGRNRFKAKNFLESLKFACEGLWFIVQTQRNFQIDLAMTVIVAGFGVVLAIDPMEWVALCIVIGLVLVSETFNTVIENTVDLYTQGEFDMRAKVIKDAAAGACLLAALFAFIVGMIIFAPKLVSLAIPGI